MTSGPDTTHVKTFQPEQAQKRLEYYFTNYKIFIDTCSLLDPAFDRFWINAEPLIRATGNKIIVPLRVLEEIKKHSTNSAKPQLAGVASTVFRNVCEYHKAQLLDIRGESTDNFADNVFQVVFTKFRMTHKLLLITQDRNLALDILGLNNYKSVKGCNVQVKRIDKFGYLSKFSSEYGSSEVFSKTQTTETINEKEKFKLSTSITSLRETLLPVSSIPSKGDAIIVQRGTDRAVLRLESVVASGGEGTVYTTNSEYVAKIYKKDRITNVRYEKIKLMLTKDIKYEGICYPVACIYNKDKQFVGYLMQHACGKELQKSLFVKPLLLKNFPNWKKRDTVELCVTILEKIKYLHQRNIIMGDINPANILVVSPKDVYFVDTDSYQIEGFPCPVGTINYTAPEIQKKIFGSFLRTLGNENFAVATLLFMIMLPGKPPYSHQGGENPVDNIINMDFSYPLGEHTNKKTPDGPWRFIWSHLPYDIKEAFYNTFQKDGTNSSEKNRLTVDEWLAKFRYYLQLLDSGKFGAQDAMSEELFPTRHKKHPNVTYVTCSLCGKEVAEESCRNGICRECLNTGEVYHCARCGKEMIFTNYQKFIKKAKRYDVCQQCYEAWNSAYTTAICSVCNRPFSITYGEYEYFQSKGLNLPKRCKDCREGRRPVYAGPRPRTTYVPRPAGSVKKRSLCFITTAACEYFHLDDDCYELSLLRHFRDTWLVAEPDGPDLIAEYYNLAPALVGQLSVSRLKDLLYFQVWQEYILPCIEYIETGRFVLCKKKYIAMVDYLRTCFSR